MRKLRFIILGGLLFWAGGCEHSAPVAAVDVPLPIPASTSLSAAARARLEGTVDLDAMDRLLTTLGPSDRARFLQTFENAERAATSRTDVETRGVSVVTWFADPVQQRLSERVWAPFWSQLPTGVHTDPSYPVPGRTLGIARRADSAAVASKEPEP